MKTASFNVRHPKRVRKRGGALQKEHRAIRHRRQTPNWRLATFKNQTTNHQAMNTDQTTVEQQRVIAQAAADFTPPEPQSHAMLMPHRDSIAMLRSKGASYRAIARILDTVKIRVSLDTLSRFCRETIEQKPERKSRRRSNSAPVSRHAENPLSDPARPQLAPDSLGLAKDVNATEPAASPRGKGPRIADPNNI